MPRYNLFIASDHAGLALKEALKQKLHSEFPKELLAQTGEWKINDLGTHNTQSCDYPDFAKDVAMKVGAAALSGDRNTLGLLICGSGIGMAIAANKVKGVRAANVWDATSARLSRQHNDSNILCMGQRLTGEQVAWDALQAWMAASFLDGRHSGRIEKISKMENV